MRVGVYTDMVFRRDRQTLTTDKAFIRLVAVLAAELGEVVLFGRLAPEPGRSPYEVPEEHIRFVALPHYPRVTHLGQVLATLPRAGKTFMAELDGLDAAVIFGPHPVALAFALLTRRARVPLVVGVRHDYPEYIRHRLPGRGWGWAVPVARWFDLAFRRLARTAPAIVVGPELGRRYARGGGHVLEIGVSLVPAAEVVAPLVALARDWRGERRCLSVGRLAAEKNPLLLVETIAELRRHDSRWRLTIAGDGPLRPAVEEAIAARRLESAVELAGEVPNGPPLWELYRRSHAFLHVSLTEGLPQVLIEAQASGVPIVATDVGGVREALGDGAGGLIVPPRRADAAVAALEQLALDHDLRRRLVLAGIERARTETLEAQVERLTAFITQAAAERAVGPGQPHPRDLRAARNSVRTRATGTGRRPRTPAAQGTASQPD
jgi:glycosyltransferase involved in cell wall biosynthesis